MKILFSALLLLSSYGFAQMDMSETHISESKALLETIKDENDFRKGGINLRSGLMSLSSNLGDPLKLNSKNQMPYLEFEGDFELGTITRGFGINLSSMIGQNLLGGTKNNSANTASSQIIFYQIGPRYRFILDETDIKNYFQVKLLYHGMSNNFKMTALDSTALSFPKSHSAILLGVERSVTVTRSYDFRAQFDLLYILDRTDIPSLNVVSKSGHGIRMQGEVFYNLKKNSRLGFTYGLSHFVNKFSAISDADTGKSSSSHSYRFLGASYSYLFH